MDKLTFKEWSILSDLEIVVPFEEDFEFSMARGELKTAQNAVKRLMTKLKGEGDLEAWVQSKITKASEYLDTVADHLSYGEDDTEKKKEVKEDWSKKYKKSIDCNDPKGFSQKAHCQGREKKVDESVEIQDANGNLFAIVTDIIKGNDQYKFKSFTQPITEDAVSELESELKKLNDPSYDSIDNLMRNIMKEHDMTAKELHDAFVKKHDKTPDEWIKESVILEACWKGYKKKGMKTMFGKKYPNCVKVEETEMNEEGLRDWFGKSKSDGGKPGWVQRDGSPCANEPGETKTPKCFSRDKLSSMSKSEIDSAVTRKREKDPYQQKKSGGAEPTRVTTDVKEESDKKTKGSGTKDACYTKVKSRYSVWPSAYASGALVKCRKVGASNWGNKSEGMDTGALAYDWDDPLGGKMERYCPKCKKNETRDICKYGPKYWDMFSIQPSLASDAYDPTEMHPANEQVSFDIGPDHNSVKKTAKIRNLATKTTNPNEKSAALRKLSGPSLPLADSVIQPGQLTTEDYQRIQSAGNVYSIIFSWRSRPMMNLQLFFPSMKRPSKEEVQLQIEKLYPGAIVIQYRPSPTDPSKPIIVIQK